jgi:hypothetical protein
VATIRCCRCGERFSRDDLCGECSGDGPDVRAALDRLVREIRGSHQCRTGQLGMPITVALVAAEKALRAGEAA